MFLLAGPKSKVLLMTVSFKDRDTTKGFGRTEIFVWVKSKQSVSNFDRKAPESIRALCAVLCGDTYCFFQVWDSAFQLATGNS